MENYQLPTPELFAYNASYHREMIPREEIAQKAQLIADCLKNEGLDITVDTTVCGPQATRFELRLGPGVSLETLGDSSAALRAALGSQQIRMLLPIPA